MTDDGCTGEGRGTGQAHSCEACTGRPIADVAGPRWSDLFGSAPDMTPEQFGIETVYTDAEVKSMCETAGELGRLLGRAEMGEQIAGAIENNHGWQTPDQQKALAFAAQIARNISPRVPGAISNGLTASSRHPGTPEDTKPPQEAL